MGDGLEFFKSWRFWALLTALALVIMLGGAGVHIASMLYFPRPAGDPVALFPMLAMYVPLFLAGGVCSLFYRRNDRAQRYHKEHRLPVMLGTFLATVLVFVPVLLSLIWLIPEPLVPDAPGWGIYRPSSIVLFGMFFGPLIASVEGVAMLDADGDEDISVTPDSP